MSGNSSKQTLHHRRIWLTISPVLAALAMATPAVEAAPLENGGVTSGSIEVPGDEDIYEFVGRTGDTVSLTMVDLEGGDPNLPGNITPRVYLYDPTGALVTSAWDYDAASIVSRSLTLNGTYTVRATDYNANQTGPYEIHLAVTPGAREHGDLVNGGVVAQALSLGDLDTYTFEASTGDTVSLSMVDLEGDDPNRPGNFTPRLYLYDPNGSYVTGDWDYRAASIVSKQLPLNGTYTVLAKDYDATLTGPYEIHFARVPGAQEHGGLVDGGAVRELLTLGDLDTYTFYGETGDTVSLTMADLNGDNPNRDGNLTPRLFLYDPNGTYITGDWDYRSASILSRRLPLDGTYTVLAMDYDATLAGPYEMHFVRAPGAHEHGELLSEKAVEQSLTLGDLDSYTFYGETGDTVSLTMTDLEGGDPNLPGDLTPRLFLYDPNGDYITGDWDYEVASIAGRPLNLNGSYTVLAMDYDATRRGPYRLEFSSTSQTVPARITPLAPEGSGMARRPSIGWEPSGYAERYLVHVRDAEGRLVFRRLFRPDNIGCAGGSGTCSIVLPDDITGSARWLVRPLNDFGFPRWSPPLYFSTVAGPPSRASAIAPKGTVTTATPVYEWTRVPNAAQYLLQIRDATGVRVREWVRAGEAGCLKAGQTCRYRFDTGVGDDAQWYVRTYNFDGFGPWSARADFDVR